MSLIIFILIGLLVPLLVVGGIVYAVIKLVGGRSSRTAGGSTTHNHLAAIVSLDDLFSQLYLLLSVLFFGATMLAANRMFDDPLSLQTTLLIMSIASFGVAYVYGGVLLLAAGIVGSFAWWLQQSMLWAAQAHTDSMIPLCGAVALACFFYAVGRITTNVRFSLTYVVLATLSITGLLFVFSSQFGRELMHYPPPRLVDFDLWQLGTLYALGVCVAGVAALYALHKNKVTLYEVGGLAMLLVLFTAVLLDPAREDAHGTLWLIAFNVVAFFEMLGLVFLGYLRRETWLINFGAGFLFLLIIVKYFDWFFTFLDKSVFFIGAGLMLFGLGWAMEKSRRYMLSSLAKSDATQP